MSEMKKVFEELQKVTWPTRKETYKNTTVVIAISLLIGVFIGIIDYPLAQLIQLLASK